MPKVYLRPIDRFRDNLKYNFRIARAGRSYEEIGKIIGRAKSTVKARADDPLTMTLDELFRFCQHENIEPADFIAGKLRLRGAGIMYERTDFYEEKKA